MAVGVVSESGQSLAGQDKVQGRQVAADVIVFLVKYFVIDQQIIVSSTINLFQENGKSEIYYTRNNIAYLVGDLYLKGSLPQIIYILATIEAGKIIFKNKTEVDEFFDRNFKSKYRSLMCGFRSLPENSGG